MQLHTWGCTEPVRDSELKVVCCHIGDSSLAFQSDGYQLSYPCPQWLQQLGGHFADLGTPLTATSFKAVNGLSSFVAKYSLKYAYVFVSARFCYCDWRLIRAFKSVN